MYKAQPHIAALIVAAGNGERFGGDRPKQYRLLAGMPVLRHSVLAFLQHPDIASVHVVYQSGHERFYREAVAGLDLPLPVAGGRTRQESVSLGLEALTALNPSHVLIHDAARPLVSASLVSSICDKLKNADAVIPAVALSDTIKKVCGDLIVQTVSRQELMGAQTPQGFAFDKILSLHRSVRTPVTDDAELVEKAGGTVTIVPGSSTNLKVTAPEDIILAESLFYTMSASRKAAA